MSLPEPQKLASKEDLDKLEAASHAWDSISEEYSFDFNQHSGNVVGTIPLQLRGTFYRNGPGLNEVYGTSLIHPIDGDGLVCSLSFEDGCCIFNCKFVETESHRLEREEGRMLFPGQMGSRPPASSSDSPHYNTRYRDPSHTNVFQWGGKVIAAHEYTFPHALQPATLLTLGRDHLNSSIERTRAMSAHFRYDADFDSLVVCGFRTGIPALKKTPRLEVVEFDRAWNICEKVYLEIDGLNYVHDFLLTPDFYIFHMTPFVDVSLETLMKIKSGQSSPGESMRYYPHLPSKMVFVERRRGVRNGTEKKATPEVVDYSDATRTVLQLDTEPCHIYHFTLCNQTVDVQNSRVVIRFSACCLPKEFTMDWQYKAFLANTNDAPGRMHSYEAILPFTSETSTAKRTFLPSECSLSRWVTPGLSDTSCEFPTTHPYRHCVRRPSNDRNNHLTYKYTYVMSSAAGTTLPFTDVVKHNQETSEVNRWHAEGVVGEPCFIPRLGHAGAWYGDEDDGWLLVQHYLPVQHRTEFLILDAKRVEDGPLARLKLPKHVPLGFHGTFSPTLFNHPHQARL